MATLFSRNEARAGHDGTNVFHLGENNTNPAGTTTVLNANGARAFDVEGGVQIGSGPDGPGLSVGDSNVGGKAIDAIAFGGGVAVYGTSRPEGTEPGDEPGQGVVGASADADGNETGPGIGVSGKTGTGIGVLGSTSTTGIGVEARTAGSETPFDAVALLVRGKSAFSTAGSAVVPAGQESVFVENAAVTGDSHVSVTLTNDPGDRGVSWVDRDPGSGFTVHLTGAPLPRRPETSLTYLIVEPFEED